MNLKRMRMNQNWSQEQLSEFSGLGLRTIQRIESENKASEESLKALAAVFKMDVKSLRSYTSQVDKSSKRWLQNPGWVRALFWGSNVVWLRSRTEAIVFEALLVVIALGFFIGSWFMPEEKFTGMLIFSLAAFVSAYAWSLLIRISDRYGIW